jgi:hypothetical protein
MNKFNAKKQNGKNIRKFSNITCEIEKCKNGREVNNIDNNKRNANQKSNAFEKCYAKSKNVRAAAKLTALATKKNANQKQTLSKISNTTDFSSFSELFKPNGTTDPSASNANVANIEVTIC